jgi:hypothetical protein
MKKWSNFLLLFQAISFLISAKKNHSNVWTKLGLIGLVPGLMGLEQLSATATAAPLMTTSARLESIESSSFKGADLTPILPLKEAIASESSLVNDPWLGQDMTSQVTSVTQLSDVQPTDWAFQALQSLVERYGCVAGYPDGSFRGNRAITRYEAAALVNACLDRVSELVDVSNLATREDLAILQRLQEEFSTELITLRGQVDALESRTAELEDNQFSTTTRLTGEAIFSLSGATGGFIGADEFAAGSEQAIAAALATSTQGEAGEDTQIAFNNRLRLNLTTSFTGSDLLITGLQSYNFEGGFGNPTGSLPGTLGLGDPVFGTASNAALGVAPQFGRTNPQTLSNRGANDLHLYKLLYIFPAFENVTLFVGTNAEVSDAFPTISPFASDSQGAVSRFAQMNPVLRVSGGTSGTGLAAAGGFIWAIADEVDFRALYGSVNANIPNNNGLAGGTPLGAGLFNGSFVAATQLTVRPNDTLNIGLNYAYSYHQINILGTGLSSSDIGSVLFLPNEAQLDAVGENTLLAIANEGISLNSIGATVNWQFAPDVSFTAMGSYIFTNLVDVDAYTNFISWMAGLHFTDILGKGNSAGLIFGQPLNRDRAGGRAFNPETAEPYHLEGYFNVRVNDHISITPGAYVLFNPEGFSENETTAVGVLRTTFSF